MQGVVPCSRNVFVFAHNGSLGERTPSYARMYFQVEPKRTIHKQLPHQQTSTRRAAIRAIRRCCMSVNGCPCTCRRECLTVARDVMLHNVVSKQHGDAQSNTRKLGNCRWPKSRCCKPLTGEGMAGGSAVYVRAQLETVMRATMLRKVVAYAHV